MARVFQGKGGLLVVDDQYGPVIISTFIGHTDVDGAGWHERVHLELIRKHSQGQKRVVSISDATQARRPSAEARKFWAESAKRTSEASEEMVLATLVVINNPVIRGAITAIGWMSEAVRAVEPFSTLNAAIAEARARLAGAGFVAPDIPDPYVLPLEVSRQPGR